MKDSRRHNLNPLPYGASRCTIWNIAYPEDTLELDGTIGGFGGCPYYGNKVFRLF